MNQSPQTNYYIMKTVYFLATLDENISFSYEVQRPDFASCSPGTRHLEKVAKWYYDIVRERPEWASRIFIVSTPTFVADLNADLEEVPIPELNGQGKVEANTSCVGGPSFGGYCR